MIQKTTYDTNKSNLEKKISNADKKIPDTSDLSKTTDLTLSRLSNFLNF